MPEDVPTGMSYRSYIEGTGPDGRKFYDIIIGAVNKAVLEGDLDRALALGPMRRGIA